MIFVEIEMHMNKNITHKTAFVPLSPSSSPSLCLFYIIAVFHQTLTASLDLAVMSPKAHRQLSQIAQYSASGPVC